MSAPGAPEDALNHSCANHHREIRFRALPCPICERRTPDFQRQWPRYVCAIPNCPICAMYAEPKQLAAPVSPLRDQPVKQWFGVFEGANMVPLIAYPNFSDANNFARMCSGGAVVRSLTEAESSPLRDAEGATAAATPPSREDYALHDELPKPLARETTIDARLLALEAVAHSPKRLDEELLNIEKRLKAYIDSKSESERILRAALFRLTSFPHTCERNWRRYFPDPPEMCVPCIAQRALDEDRK